MHCNIKNHGLNHVWIQSGHFVEYESRKPCYLRTWGNKMLRFFFLPPGFSVIYHKCCQWRIIKVKGCFLKVDGFERCGPVTLKWRQYCKWIMDTRDWLIMVVCYENFVAANATAMRMQSQCRILIIKPKISGAAVVLRIPSHLRRRSK